MLGFSISTGHGLSGPLYRVDQVPESFHEQYIIRGYRQPKSSVTQCLLSLFDATNETLNCWTHFLPTWYFVWVVYQLSGSMDFYGDPYNWPLFCLLLCCCTFPMVSATAHLFNVMSHEARQVCFFFDYAALSVLSVGGAIAYRAYSFPVQLLVEDSPYAWYTDNFICMAVFNALFCTAVTCTTRFMKQSPLRKVLRTGAFVYPYFFDYGPIVCRIVFCTGDDCQLASNYYFKWHFVMAFLSVFLYGSHLPERLLPGSFDIVGHSHQLFHVATVFSVFYVFQAILLEVKDRRHLVEPKWDFESASNSIGTMAFVLAANALIIAFYTLRLYRQRHHQKTV